jgi:hypothetical protein
MPQLVCRKGVGKGVEKGSVQYFNVLPISFYWNWLQKLILTFMKKNWLKNASKPRFGACFGRLGAENAYFFIIFGVFLEIHATGAACHGEFPGSFCSSSVGSQRHGREEVFWRDGLRAVRDQEGNRRRNNLEIRKAGKGEGGSREVRGAPGISGTSGSGRFRV